MTTQTDQTTNGDGRQSGAEPDAKTSDTWESMIKDFETQTGNQDQSSAVSSAVLKALKPVVDYVETDRIEKQQAVLDGDLDKAMDFVAREETLSEVPKSLLRGLMEAYAAEDKGFARAFQNRSEAPGEWESQLEKGRSWAAEQVKALTKDAKPKDDIAAAKAAVAGTQNEAASAPDDDQPSVATMVNMSGAEWEQFKMEQRVKAAN